ncbi:MAG: DinB family protein [Chloroflexota bacterium]
MAGDEIADLLDRLSSTPSRIGTAAAGRSEHELTTIPPRDEWSPRAVLAHMRASDDILAPRLIAMLVREEPMLPAFDDRHWCDVMGYDSADFAELLMAFTARRAELVAALRRLDARAWRRTGTHEARGQTSMLETLRHLVDHESEHCLQLEAMLA